MNDKILDGKALAEKLNLALKVKINEAVDRIGIKPKIVTILVGEDPASKVYLNMKKRTSAFVGIESEILELDEHISKEKITEEINKLNTNDNVHGILLQLPLPKSQASNTLNYIENISPKKDVDGLTPVNKGKLYDYNENLAPCTPTGIITLLEYYNIELKGKEVVIINRSNLVGKPLIFMMLKRNATVSVCHTSTINIENHMRRADILVVAVRHPNFVTKEKIKKGAIIIDVGINRVNGKLCGDVNFEDVFEKSGKITPSPGGIGPLTVHFLLQNTFTAYKNQLGINF
ncbi:MAG: bifunctional 5,10-methylenetetrahydrofolate dehydrogenase/5,10-methenyltetrahydrofolate cyclohydrolase [Candidatus Lokiarchaeota archaeon]|nr:bifunctional 5,10-methylenetetrahydrofolate dehydrogenase/5,10-methenyltetrahydrofolate cyclohydrolase [Candidatus Lokiarchaeota archaeon]